MNPQQLTQLLIEELKDIYHAETQLVKALPKMAKAAHSATLKEAMTEHLSETQNQVGRLEQVFSLLNTTPKAKPCKGMQGLLAEGSEKIEEQEKGALLDLGIIAAAQRVEHYEISAYGTARAIAEQIGNAEVARLLEETENEEKAADDKLSEVAGEIYDSSEAEQENESEVLVGAGSSRNRGSSKRK
jgi:ferritin-like metal-binding protein YciE